MKDALRQTRSHLMELFEQQGVHPRTALGQNFLIDLNLIEYIVRQAELGPRDVVLEVGSGTGGMTAFLAQDAGAVVSVELDPNMHRLVQEATARYENVTLLHTDALKNKNNFAPEVLDAVTARLAEAPGRRLKLVSNLPYNIATPVVSNLVASDLPWERMVVTIQWELAERMAARPSTGDYSALSVWLQSQCRLEILKKLPPTVFWPRPRVDSAIVLLVPWPEGKATIRDRPFFQDFLRRIFQKRRKLARSVLVGMYRKQLAKPEIDAVLEQLGLPEHARAGEMDVPRLVELANRLHETIQQH